MQQQKCCLSDHKEPIIGICLSNGCGVSAVSCYQCLKQFHFQHENEWIPFKILTNQLTEYTKANSEFVEKVIDFKLKFDELYKIFLNKKQAFIVQLNSINQLIQEQQHDITDSDIDFLKNYQRINQNNWESHFISKLYQIMDSIQKVYLDTFKFDNQNQKVDTQQNSILNQTIVLNQNEIDVMIQQGIDLFKNNNFQQSLDFFERVLEIEKSHQEAKDWKIQCLIKMKKYHEVVEECDRIIKDDSQCFEIYLKKSEALLSLQKNDQAREHIQKGIEINPIGVIQLIYENIKLFNSENLDQMDAQNLKEIISLSQSIIHENLNTSKLSLLNLIEELPDSQTLWLQQKNQTHYKNEFDELSDDKKQQKSNEIIEIKQLQTTINYSLKQLNQIILNYEDNKQQIGISQQKDQYNIIEDNKKNNDEFLSPHLQQGDMLIKQQNYEEAIKFFNKIIQEDSNNWIAHKNKAQCLYLLELHEESIKNSNLAIHIDPQRFESYLIKGRSLVKLKRYEEAIESLETVIKLDKTQHKAYALKGFALHNLGRFKEAITQLDIALFIFSDESYLIQKADSLFEIQQYQEAITIYVNALNAGTKYTNYICEKLKSIQIN